ncbi:AB hydrolase-1 domain-containing protein [Mycena sanguinolenta]|uniref:AB hydrolase-1 domain-containing protein n=1 Tax=Mycena sanguinolenta TaxID=230812 RepID=A0A8H6YHL4_9AGAR|nr:AB hydrolase-1 domain-containing protein [Mycena sanguinolenta]
MKSYYIVWSFTGLNAWIWSAVFHTRDLSTTEKLDYFSAALTIFYALYYTVIRLFHLYPVQQRSRLSLSTRNSSPDRSLTHMGWSLLCILVYLCHVSYLTLLPRFDYVYNIIFNLVIGLTHNALWLVYSLPVSFFRRFPDRPQSYRPRFVTKAGVFVALTTAATALELFDFPPFKRVIDAHSLWHLATAPIAVLWYDFLVQDARDESWRDHRGVVCVAGKIITDCRALSSGSLEVLSEMIGQTLPEYIFIRICIAGLRLVAPASFAFLLACAATRRILVSPVLLALAACEALFYAVFFFRWRRFNKKIIPLPPRLTRSQRRDLFNRSAAHITPDHFLGWFLPPNSDIKRENVEEWILWAMFVSTPEHASPEWDEEIEEYMLIVEKSLGRKLEPGRVPGVKSLRLSFDPIQALHRPLILYIVQFPFDIAFFFLIDSLFQVIAIVDALSSVMLLSLGFKYYAPRCPHFRTFPPRPLLYLFSKPGVTPHFPYWYRPPRAGAESKNPILFLHGIGIGLFPYIPLFQELLRADSTRSLILVEFLPVSFRMTGPMPPRRIILDSINDILEDLNIGQVTLAAQSYGTFLAGHIVCPPDDAASTNDPALTLNHKVAALVLIDPIPFLLHLPTVAHNFLYRAPGRWRANEWQLWYFASRDADVARVLGRCFFWEEGCIWREDLQRFSAEGNRRVSVLLGGGDQIVPSAAVRDYLIADEVVEWTPAGAGSERWVSRTEQLEVLWFPGLDHATVFETKERRKVLIQALEPPCTSGAAI